jgi:hypothetical protein
LPIVEVDCYDERSHIKIRGKQSVTVTFPSSTISLGLYDSIDEAVTVAIQYIGDRNRAAGVNFYPATMSEVKVRLLSSRRGPVSIA